MVEVSPTRGTTTTTSLLIPLSPDSQNRRRVLCIEDCAPTGCVVESFDADGQPDDLHRPFAWYERITLEQAQKIVRSFGR